MYTFVITSILMEFVNYIDISIINLQNYLQ